MSFEYILLIFVAGRYAVRYGKLASEVVKKQVAHIPSGLVGYLLLFIGVVLS